MEPLGDGESGQGAHRAGHQRRIVHDADADDFQHEDHGGDRRSEQSGEASGHAAQHQDMPVLFRQMEPGGQSVAQAAAQLQGCAFPAGGTAEQMRQNGRGEDQRRHDPGHAVIRMNGVNDKIRAVHFLVFIGVVHPGDQQACQRQQIHQPGMRLPEACGVIDAPVEQRSHASAQCPAQCSQQNPAQNLDQILPVCA